MDFHMGKRDQTNEGTLAMETPSLFNMHHCIVHVRKGPSMQYDAKMQEDATYFH